VLTLLFGEEHQKGTHQREGKKKRMRNHPSSLRDDINGSKGPHQGPPGGWGGVGWGDLTLERMWSLSKMREKRHTCLKLVDVVCFKWPRKIKEKLLKTQYISQLI
jgi:hypothetical protein